MPNISYSVEEIRRMIEESSQEFKAVLGKNVEQDNAKNNSEFYKSSKKKAQDYDGGMQEPKDKGPLPDKADGNRTTIEYNPKTEPSDEYKRKVAAQAKGYTSELEEKNGNERGGVEMDDKGRILKQFSDAQDVREEIKTALQKSGLQARTYPDSAFEKKHLHETAKPKAKRLKFKHTTFITEQQVLNRIPEEYKTDGQRIHMVDKADNEYIVECVKSRMSGNVEVNIVARNNKRVMNEEVGRMFELMDYKPSSRRASVREKAGEQSEFERILNEQRKREEVE